LGQPYIQEACHAAISAQAIDFVDYFLMRGSAACSENEFKCGLLFKF